VALFWFLLGLGIGLAGCVGYHVALTAKLKRAVQDLHPEILGWSMSSTAQLTRAIAAQLQDQQFLEQTLATWKQIFNICPFGFLQVDEDNQLLWCNPQAFSLLNIHPVETHAPRLLLELVRSYELDALIDETRRLGKPWQKDWTFNPVFTEQVKLAQQQPQPLRGYAFPLLDGSVGVFLEDRQESTALAQQRDRWISDVAHELKTPLTSIRLVAETLQIRLEPPLRTWIDRLLQETLRLSDLVQDLLDLNRLQASPSLSLDLQTGDLPQLITTAWSSLEPITRQKLLRLDYRGPAVLPIQVDLSRLHRVLLNLLDNSIKYSPTQQAIQVRLDLQPHPDHPHQTCVHLAVIDAGPGFPEEALPFVFDRFYRVDVSRMRTHYGLPLADRETANRRDPVLSNSSGSGLGLAIVQQIVEAHQGIVRASNHPDTHGAWLEVFLPWTPPSAAGADTPTSAVQTSGVATHSSSSSHTKFT
jgi:two-component system, OmpR family, phosphate regulon sensor histidine kinase PhoR